MCGKRALRSRAAYLRATASPPDKLEILLRNVFRRE